MGMKFYDRDIDILYFIWRYKVATTRALVGRFFYNTAETSESGYRRLLQLQREGLIGDVWAKWDRKHCWRITEKGYKYLKECRIERFKAGYFKPEHAGHDLFTAAILIGPWLRKAPAHVQIVSENQLKSFDPLDLPDEVTKDFSHTPDGYWILQQNNQTEVIALEVELNPKTKRRYGDVGFYYSRCKDVKLVLWVVKNTWIANQFLKTVGQYSTGSLEKHCFALAEDVLAQGWQAKFLSGLAKGKTFNEVLNYKTLAAAPAGQNGVLRASEALPRSDKLVFLECQKSSKVTSPSYYYQVGDFT